MTDPKVTLLDGGSLVIDGSQVHWHHDLGDEVRFPVYSVLVQIADGPNILFDTGFDLDHVNAVLPFEKPLQSPEQTIPAQLALCGLAPEDIDIVINSHFHFDHVGGNKYLTNAQILVHKDELRHALVPEPFERLGYSDLSFNFDKSKYKFISGEYEIAPGVTLIETPGHTVAHYSMLVEFAGAPAMLFAGDAAYTYKALEAEVIGGFHLDPSASIDSLRKLSYISRTKGADIYPSHEMAPWLLWKKAPESYGG
ncbi:MULTISPECIES: N-acyl homoserine lactonase family protein [unclassified Leucobacter]|uniref:4-pyridoxolactonase n=1 Tax=unclassified Leucobacter TaxID=2621730 RepID=UPI00165D33ED|nr:MULTISPECIES: N-acyl homoserine lactonase family protein [unclassified Leucobacter]MBC9926204.1 N-acyl homoserine lactonase family protein [Leucobacter sp. cx-169]